MKRKLKKNKRKSYKKAIVLILGIGSLLIILLFILNLILVEQSWYQDLDKDGFGNRQVHVQQRFKPDGYVSNKEDNDDKNACQPINGKQCQQKNPVKKTANRKDIIKKLLNAENSRDTTSLKEIYRKNNITYFTKNNVTLDELIRHYKSIWKKLELGKNKLISTAKIQEDRYEYITQFTWESKSGKSGVSTDTILVQFDVEKISSVIYRHK